MYPTQYGDIVQVVISPTVYKTVQPLGYHHLGDLYTEDSRVKQERALKERAPTRKGIQGLRVWLTRHAAILVPLLREPPPRWQAAPRDPERRARVPGGRGHRRPSGQNHPNGDHVPQGTSRQGDRGHEGYHGGGGLGAATQGMPPAPRHTTKRHKATPPLGGPSGCSSAGGRALACPLWDDHHHVSLAQLQRTGVWAPTIVWMAAPPTDAYWRWAQTSQTPLVTVTAALPPCPWMAIAPAAVAKFKYPAECVAHKCPGHPNKGPLYYSLDTVGTVPAELNPALHTHLREHHGDLALLAPHGRATDPPNEVAPEV